MKILIIGSAGFIGKNLVAFLKNKNHEVFRADIMMEEQTDYFLLAKENSDFDKLFLENKFDICYNCSGAANVNFSIQNPLLDYELNTYNVYKILDAIRKHNKGCKFVNLSSAAVYGNPLEMPVSETTEGNPISPYGFHKLAAENIGFQFAALYGIAVINVRIFSVYGPGLTKQIFWDVFLKHQQAGPIKLYGTGEETRDFIYIDDLCRALEVSAMNTTHSSIINIASGKSITVKKAVGLLLENLGNTGVVAFNNEQRVGDPLYWEADISRFLESGPFEFTKIDEGLQKTAQWMLTLS